MSVIITNGNMNLSTANGFYRVEAYNLGAYYNGALALSTARTIAVTFANSGNCQGLIISLSGTSTVTKSVTVKLQEYVGSTWTDRATVTKTRDEICNSVTNAFSYGGWIVPFVFSSPYAVTTAASTWRFEISEGSGTSDWSIRTSDGTNPFYVTWCDNALSFSDNDTVIIKDILYIDQTATFRGLLGTGETAISTCGVICRSTDPTPTGVSLLRWKKTPDTSYTLTLDGCIYFGAHSGFRVGSENVTVTMTIADPCVVTYTSHGLTDGEGVRFKTTGALPTGITAGTIYYVRSTDCSTPANEFWLYDSAAHAVAGGTTGRVATSGTQSGTHSVVWRIPIAQKAIIEFDTTPTYGTALCSGFQDGKCIETMTASFMAKLDEAINGVIAGIKDESAKVM